MSSCQDQLFDREDSFRVHDPCMGSMFTADNLQDCIDFLNSYLKKRGYTRSQCERNIQVHYRDQWLAVREEVWWDKIE